MHYRLGISFIKPITSATLQLGDGLRIELIIVYVPGQTDRGRQRNRYETAAAAGVAEDIRNVCRSDERSDTWQRNLLLAVRLTELDTCKLHDILQKTVLCLGRQRIELVNIDQQRLCHSPQRILFLTDDEIVIISPLQRLGQKPLAEGRLPIALPGDEQRCHTVAVQCVQSHPLCHHRKKPRVEPVGPPVVVIGYTIRQGLDMIVPVPSSSQTIQEIFHRVETLDKPRLRIASDVLVPYINPVEACLDGDCVAHPFIRCHKRFVTARLADFCTT